MRHGATAFVVDADGHLSDTHKKEEEPVPCGSDPSVGGGYLLSHFRSTIGVVRLNFSVRNGKRWNPHAITTFVRLSARYCAP